MMMIVVVVAVVKEVSEKEPHELATTHRRGMEREVCLCFVGG